MKEVLESIPELRLPNDNEHQQVMEILVPMYKKQAKHNPKVFVYIGLLFSALLVGDLMHNGLNHIDLKTTIVLSILILICLYMIYSTQLENKRLNKVIEDIEKQQYHVVPVSAINIHDVVGSDGNGGTMSYGLAHVQLDNGRMLKKEYTLPYRYAKKIEEKGLQVKQPMLLVRSPIIENDQLIPFNTQSQA